MLTKKKKLKWKDNMDIIDHISEVSPEALLLDSFDDAIIGLAERINLGPVVAYDVEKILEIMRVRDEMTYEEAYEYYEYNIKGAWMGDYTPVFVEVYNPEEYPVNINIEEREVIKIDMKNDEFDFTSSGPWEIYGHTYVFVDDNVTYNGDDECHNIIIKRLEDNKFFTYEWLWCPHSGDYIFDKKELVEVFKRTITTTVYE